MWARVVFALVGHPGHGADRRFNAEPPSNAASKLWRPANGPLRRRRSPRRSMAPRGATTRCDQRSCTNAGYFCGPVRGGVCPLQVQGTSHRPAPPTLGVGEAGDDGPAGDRPRAMPLRAAPGESSGLRRVQPEPNATRNRCYRRPLRALRGACQRCKRTAPPQEPRSRRLWQHREAPSGISESDSTAAARAYGRG